jgi:hypothetical protein
MIPTIAKRKKRPASKAQTRVFARRKETDLPRQDTSVEALRKISVAFEAGSAQMRTDIDLEPARAEFIFGIGTTGLTALEARLAGKKVGDTVVFPLDRGQLPAVAGHLCRLMPKIPDGDDPVYLRVRIEDVRTPENREVVKAMADAGACGEGCSCGH